MVKATANKKGKGKSTARRKPTIVKSAPKVTKSKPKGKKGGKNGSKAKKIVEQEAVKPPLPSHWPVSSNNITHHSESEASAPFQPGSILQKCSGQDIKITKQAEAKVDFEKNKGKFLFIFPGQISFHPTTPSSSTSADKRASATPNKKRVGNESDTSEKESTEAPEAKNKSASKLKPFQADAKNYQSFGKIYNLDKENPRLVISLPNEQTLTFTGTKVKCSTKYLALNCRTSGAVTCKNIFQDLVVFGDYKVERDGNLVTVTENNDRRANEIDNNDSNSGFQHYGGSDRAVDGGRILRGGRKAAPKRTIVEKDHYETKGNESSGNDHKGAHSEIEILDSDSDSNFDGDNDRDKEEAISKPPARRGVRARKSIDEMILDRESDDEDDDDEISEKEEETSERRAHSRKQLSSEGEKMTEHSDDTNSENDDDSYRSVEETKKIKHIYGSNNKNRNKKTAKKDCIGVSTRIDRRQPMKGEDVMDLTLDSDTDDIFAISTPTKPNPKKRSSSQSPFSPRRRRKGRKINIPTPTPKCDSKQNDIRIDDVEFNF